LEVMKIQNYLKKTIDNNVDDAVMEDKFINFVEKIVAKKKKIGMFVGAAVIVLIVGIGCCTVGKVSFSGENGLQFANLPIASATNKKGTISIPSGTVKANPFLPYRDLGKSSDLDVPECSLPEPPTDVNEHSDAARVMDTVVSGILYDRYSPSAILNIEGTDYLVKKGDVVNNYKVLSILKDSVTVKLGANTYKAGIGEILTEGTVNRNDVSNLNTKFGGRK